MQIAGVTVATPNAVNVGSNDITKSSRAASGKMQIELIATKKKVKVSWANLSDTDFQTIMNTIAANKPFFSLIYPDAGQDNTITCFVDGDPSADLASMINGVKLWNLTINFTEQ
jgi:hypothetical protein